LRSAKGGVILGVEAGIEEGVPVVDALAVQCGNRLGTRSLSSRLGVFVCTTPFCLTRSRKDAKQKVDAGSLTCVRAGKSGMTMKSAPKSSSLFCAGVDRSWRPCAGRPPRSSAAADAAGEKHGEDCGQDAGDRRGPFGKFIHLTSPIPT
jgi:hypothetical protein